MGGQGKNMLLRPYDSRQEEVRQARSRARRDRFENGSEGVCCVNVLQILDIVIYLAKSLKETELTVPEPLQKFLVRVSICCGTI